MSFSNPKPTKPTNPAELFLEWQGKEGRGYFTYYDKTRTEDKNVRMPFTLKFIILEELFTIKGFNEDLRRGIFSNEVLNLNKEILNINYFRRGEEKYSDFHITKGIYNEDMKKIIKGADGKFTKSWYVMFKDERPESEKGHNKLYYLANISINGGGLGTWKEAKINKEQFAIGVTGKIQKTRGAVTYECPTFVKATITNEDRERALAMDRDIVQPYLKEYLAYMDHFSKNEVSADKAETQQKATEQKAAVQEQNTSAAEMKENVSNPPPINQEEEDLPF